MRRKFMITLVLSAILSFSCCIFSACGDDTPSSDHVHSSEWTYVPEGDYSHTKTCTADGCPGVTESCTFNSTVTKEATCSSTGIRTYTCMYCSNSYTEEIAKTEHTYVASVTTPATDTEDGVMTYTCSVCGDSYTEAIPTGTTVHDYVSYQNGDVTVESCLLCGDTKVEIGSAEQAISYTFEEDNFNAVTNNDADPDWWNGATDSLSVSGDFILQYTWTNSRDTSYSDMVFEMTDGTSYWDANLFGADSSDRWGDLFNSSTSGLTFYLNGEEVSATPLGTAGAFGGSYTFTVVRSGNTLLAVVSVTNDNGVYAAAYTDTAFTTTDLSVLFTGNPYWVDDLQVSLPTMHVHTYGEGVVTKEATCSEEGEITYTCSECGATLKEAIEKTDHVYDEGVVTKEPTCSAGEMTYTCTVCGETYVEEFGEGTGAHTYKSVSNGNETLSYCTECGAQKLTVGGKDYSFSSGSFTSVTNNDKSSEWWDGATDYVGVTGDFILQYTWTNTRDPNYVDVVLEMTDGTSYWDVTLFGLNSGDRWGDLYGSTQVAFLQGGDSVSGIALGTEGAFAGKYTLTVARYGSQLFVSCVLVHEDYIYTVVYYSASFTGDDLSVGLTGNTYWIDNVKMAHTHNYDEGVVATKATCTTAGTKTHTCATCGNTITQSYTIGNGTHTYQSLTNGDITIQTCKVCGDQQYTVEGTAYSFSSSDFSSVTNNDTDPVWWSGGGTNAVTLSGNFIIQYTWTNSRDTSYTDAVLEFCDGTSYWDATVFDTSGWGDLYAATLLTQKDGASASIALGTADAFGGAYTLTAIRDGSNLLVTVVLVHADYVYMIAYTQTSFTEADVTVCLTGNTYWIDNIRFAQKSLHTHSYTSETTKEATCTEEGEITYTCECGDSYTEVVAALGHTGDLTYTANDDGTHTGVCESENCPGVTEDCTYVLVEGSETRTSCDEEGEATYRCSVCGHEITVKLEAGEHNLVKVEAVAATCETAGNIEYYVCTRCGAIFADENGETALTADKVVVEALGHNIVKVEAVAATCETDGNKEYYVCRRCGAIFADENGETALTAADVVIDALGHDFTNTSYTSGDIQIDICSVCGKQSVTVDGTAYTFADDDFADVANNDTDAANWWNQTTDYISVSGNFFVQYTWNKTEDEGSTDVAIEMFDGAWYWDSILFEANSGWGGLYTSATMTNTIVSYGTSSLGTYTVSIVREGSDLLITVSLVQGDVIYTQVYTGTDFTTSDLKIVLTGNPYFISDIRVAVQETTACTHSYVTLTAGDVSVTYCELCGAGDQTITVANSDASLELFDSDFTDIVTTDTAGDWNSWSYDGATDASGDFIVQYTWHNYRDTGYTDTIIEVRVNDGYILDLTVFGSNGWLYDNGLVDITNYMTVNAVLTSDNYSSITYGGTYTVSVIRAGNTLYILQVLENAGETYWVLDSYTGFFTDDVTVILAGNAYWIDDIAVASHLSHAHDFVGVVTIEPTCTEEGVRTYTCSVCNDTYTEVIPATGHELEKVEAVAATCETAGNIEYYVCSNCSKIFDDAEGTNELDAADVVEAALGHDLEKIEAVAATCETAGNIEYYKCTRCGAIFADENGETALTAADVVIDALGHVFIDPEYTNGAITTEICSVCGKQVVTVDGTTYSFADSDFMDIANNDTSADWWGDGATDYVFVSGDFVVQFTWEKTTDAGYVDVALEMISGSLYWDSILFTANSGWGELYLNSTTMTNTFSCDGATFCGTYTATIVREGSNLLITVSLVEDDAVYTQVYTATDFTTDALKIWLAGNPYFISDVRVAMDDESIKTTADAKTKAAADAAVTTAVTEIRATATQTARDELLSAVQSTGVGTVGTVGENNDLSVNAWWDDTTNDYASASVLYTPAVSADGTFSATIEYYQFTDRGLNYHSASTVLYSGGTVVNVLRQDNYGWGSWYGNTTLESNYDWTTFLIDVDGAAITETISYDGTNLVVKYVIVPIDAGTTYTAEESVTLSDGTIYTATASYTVPDSYEMVYTMAVTASDITFRLVLEYAYCEIMSVSGVEVSAD